MSAGDGTEWLPPDALLALVERDVVITGDESPRAVLMAEPALMVNVSSPSVPPLDLHTYQVRLARWEAGEGPRLTGMPEFVQALATTTVPTRAAVVSGTSTTYTFLLDAAMSKVLACVATDAPAPTAK
ncbi:hypothetical protein [Nocardioides zeicaulis]|uniref:Uncharacterized protein n=1 Tax=Nocardioides zeicaulis TaxID=1776857 RepID=A0ABV6DWH6_9ACTN